MSTHHLRCSMVTECKLRETFKIFEDPRNLAKITPAWLNFQVMTENVQMKKGAEIEYTIHWLGLPMHWKTLIVEYEPPFRFVDEQAEGPYKLWRHTHTFEETIDGTNVGDHVEYALPFGGLGDIAHALMVKRQLRSIFEYRQRELPKMLGGKTRELSPPAIT